jgi:drug/metabolite transporter (DMT)-like permease
LPAAPLRYEDLNPSTRTGYRAQVIDWVLLVLPGMIWGASFLFIAEGLEAVGPAGVTFIRIGIGFLTLTLVPGARRPLRAGDGWQTAALGVVWLAFPLSMFPFAELHVSSALTGMLNGAMPLFAATVASVISRQLPARPILLGLAVGFAGAIVMAMPALTNSGEVRGQALGVLLILMALVSYGFAINLARALQLRSGALPVMWRALGVAVLLTAPFGIPEVLHARWSVRPVAALVALGAFGTGIAYVLTATAAGRMGATRASATTFLIPVVALLLGIVVRHERVEPISIAGAAICLTGAWIIRIAGTAPPKTARGANVDRAV